MLDQVKAYADTIYPRGRIILDPENAASLEFDDIPTLLGAEAGSSFNFTSERVSKLNPSRIYYQYQQYHQGVIVDNGGYTVLAAPNFGTQPGCDQSGIYGISPGIATGINVNTTAAISQEEATASIGNNLVINTSELSIVWGLTEENSYHLIYKVDYREGNMSYRAWVDAQNGSILKKAEISMDLFATTINYCDQNLDDSPTLNGGRILETQDGILTTYAFPDNLDPFNIANYTQNLIPIISTWQEAMEETELQHKRGLVIGHWFYLISQGSGPGFEVPIPPLGIEKAIEIVLEALLILNNPQADYPDFMEAVEMAVDLNWDPCSMETTSVRRAFKRIGLGDSETCAFVNVKPRYCESDAGIQLCIEEGFSGDQYRWYFPSEWTVQGAGNTNSVEGNCLTVVDWPDYDYYPRNFNIRLFNTTQSVNLNYTIRMEDCEGDDPSCNDVESITPPTSETAEEKSDNSFSSETFYLLRVFDINGRKVYEGENINRRFRVDNTDGLLIYCYYDSQGKIIETKKMINIK